MLDIENLRVCVDGRTIQIFGRLRGKFHVPKIFVTLSLCELFS